jgi:predicted DNA-binding protein
MNRSDLEPISTRLPRETIEKLDKKSEETGFTRSELIRLYVEYGNEVDAGEVTLTAEIDQIRRDIKDRARPIDLAGGFPGRVQEAFEERFKNGYAPEWIVAKAESFREEARRYEELISDHPDAPEVEEGEFVEEVDRVLRETLEAQQLSDWRSRTRNSFEKFEGVESGRKSRQLALVLTRNAMEIDQDLEPFRSSSRVERRVRGSDLPELAEQDLPENVSREEVAGAARRLLDGGLEPEDISTDPTEFDPFGWNDGIGELKASEDLDGTQNAEPLETDGGSSNVVEISSETTDSTELKESHSEEISVEEEIEPEPEESKDLTDLVEWASEKLNSARNIPSHGRTDSKIEEIERKRREEAEEKISIAVDPEQESWRSELMQNANLTDTDLIELAEEYNNETERALLGEREEAPEIEVEENGGVSIE